MGSDCGSSSHKSGVQKGILKKLLGINQKPPTLTQKLVMQRS
jgi:hypothetical protein